MAPFEFVMVVISIIIGLAIAEILMGVVDVLRTRSFERTYWLHSIWVLQMFVLAVQHWAIRWGLQDYSGWNYLTLLMLLLPTVAIFLAAGVLFPKEQIALREYYYQQRSIFFSILLVLMVLYSVEAWTLFGLAPGGRGDRFRLISVVLYVPLIASARPRVHIVATAAHALAVLVSFTTLFGGRGGKLML